jgi:hypothetical protein
MKVPAKPRYVSSRGSREATSAPKNWALKMNRNASRQMTARR